MLTPPSSSELSAFSCDIFRQGSWPQMFTFPSQVQMLPVSNLKLSQTSHLIASNHWYHWYHLHQFIFLFYISYSFANPSSTWNWFHSSGSMLSSLVLFAGEHHGESVSSNYGLLPTTSYRLLDGPWGRNSTDVPQTEVTKFGGTSCQPRRPLV